MMCVGYAQVVEQGEAALVYYSPKNLVALDFTYTVEKQEPGLYAQYAEAMIGAKEVIKEKKTSYSIKDVVIRTKTVPDVNRPHKVMAEADFPLLLTMKEKGLLLGYNLPYTEPEAPARPACPAPMEDKTVQPAVVSFPEEVLKAATPLAQANAVAKQIFHLRETRMYLLNGEVEHAPADGQSMKQVLAELDRQEQELLKLFVGKRSCKTEHKLVVFNPEEKKQILYFSEENGFTDAENLEASTIVVSVNIRPQQYKKAADDKKKQKAAPVSQLVYNLPGSGDVKVLYKGNELAKRMIPVAQCGIDIPLPKEVFKGTKLPVIEFDPKTGNIISITQ